MQRLEVSGAVRPLYGSLGVKELMYIISNAISKPILDRAMGYTYFSVFYRKLL